MKIWNVLEKAPAGHLLRLFVGGMRICFERLRRQVAAQSAQREPRLEKFSETRLESLVWQERLKQAKAASAQRRKRRG